MCFFFFLKIGFTYIYRKFKAAHRLAKFSFDQYVNFEWTGGFPPWMDGLDVLM